MPQAPHIGLGSIFSWRLRLRQALSFLRSQAKVLHVIGARPHDDPKVSDDHHEVLPRPCHRTSAYTAHPLPSMLARAHSWLKKGALDIPTKPLHAAWHAAWHAALKVLHMRIIPSHDQIWSTLTSRRRAGSTREADRDLSTPRTGCEGGAAHHRLALAYTCTCTRPSRPHAPSSPGRGGSDGASEVGARLS